MIVYDNVKSCLCYFSLVSEYGIVTETTPVIKIYNCKLVFDLFSSIIED